MCNRYRTPEDRAAEDCWGLGVTLPLFTKRDVHPRSDGWFIRARDGQAEAVVGVWGLIPSHAKTRKLAYDTNNARSEELMQKASYRPAWVRGQRCVIPAECFWEPCWETFKNVWWRFERQDGLPWALAGIWDRWVDQATGESVESYSMLTQCADGCPLFSRMHQPDLRLRPEQQDKRSVVVLERENVATWLYGSRAEALECVRLADPSLIKATPEDAASKGESEQLGLFG